LTALLGSVRDARLAAEVPDGAADSLAAQSDVFGCVPDERRDLLALVVPNACYHHDETTEDSGVNGQD
jgi:hypothetical protein